MDQTPDSVSVIFKSRSFFIAALGYFAALCLLFWQLLTGNSLHAGAQLSLDAPFANADASDAVPYLCRWEGDFVLQFACFEEYQFKSARQGRFPTWNPSIFAGQPFHADGQSAMLFPSHWIYFLIDPNRARGPTAIARLWLSAMAMFCLLRRFSLAPTAAFVGGSIWTFGSFNMHWLLFPHTNATLWLPVTLLALDGLLVAPSRRRFAIASLLATPLFLAGHPGTEYLCVQLIAVYIFTRVLMARLPLRQAMKLVLAAFAAMGAGLLAAAVAVLPLVLQILRSHEYLDTGGHRGAVPPLSFSALWLLLVPEYFGRPRGPFWIPVDVPPANYLECTLWFGAIAFLLAVVGFCSTFLSRRGGRTQFPPVFAAIVFLLSLGIAFSIWPVGQWVGAMAGSELTNLHRVLFATQFAGAILAACAIDQILVRKNLRVVLLAGILCAAGSIITVSAVAGQWDKFDQNWKQTLLTLAGQSEHRPQIARSMIEQFAGYRALAGAGLLIAGTVVVLCIVWLTVRRREIPRGLRYALAAIITLDVLLPAYDFTPIAPLNLAVPPAPQIVQSMISQTGDGRALGVGGVLGPNLSMHYGFRDIRGYDLPHDQRQVQLLERLHLADANDEFNLGTIKLTRLYPVIDPELSAYLNRTCVRSVMLAWPDSKSAASVASLKPLPSGLLNWPRVESTPDNVMVFRNPNAVPRLFFAENAEPADNAGAAMDALLDGGTGPRVRSVYEGAVVSRRLITAVDGEPLGTARITSDEPETVVIESQSASEHLLILSDRMDPGWQARIDEKPAEAMVANYMFRGVIVPGGHHTIRWTYHAPGLAGGFWISVVTLAMLLGLVALPRQADKAHRAAVGDPRQRRGLS